MFCQAVISGHLRGNGFFYVFFLVVFLITPIVVEAAYEDDIILGAKQGDAQAQYALALLYEYGGETVARDHKKSLQIGRASCRERV